MVQYAHSVQYRYCTGCLVTHRCNIILHRMSRDMRCSMLDTALAALLKVWLPMVQIMHILYSYLFVSLRTIILIALYFTLHVYTVSKCPNYSSLGKSILRTNTVFICSSVVWIWKALITWLTRWMLYMYIQLQAWLKFTLMWIWWSCMQVVLCEFPLQTSNVY